MSDTTDTTESQTETPDADVAPVEPSQIVASTPPPPPLKALGRAVAASVEKTAAAREAVDRAKQATDEGAGFGAAFKALQGDVERLSGELKSREAKLAAALKEAEALRGQVEGFTRREREGALVDRIRKDLPHAEPLVLRGVLSTLHEAGKVDRYAPADKLEDAAKAAIELIKTEAPTLARPPAPPAGAGPGAAPTQPAPARKHRSPIG